MSLFDKPYRSGSLVSLSSADLTQRCQAKLDRMAEAEKKGIEILLRTEAARMDSGWWHRLFKLPATTPEQARDNINQGGLEHMWDQFTLQGFKYDETRRLCYKLIRAAAAGDPVHLTVEDLHVIS